MYIYIYISLQILPVVCFISNRADYLLVSNSAVNLFPPLISPVPTSVPPHTVTFYCSPSNSVPC